MNVNIRPDHEKAAFLYNRLPDWAKGEVSTSLDRFAYIMGVVEEYKPVNMVEVGVSAGTLSAVMLTKALGYSDEAVLHGIDFGHHTYFDEQIRIGQVIDELFPELKKSFHLNTGKMALDADSIIGGELDFVYIDANHCHPWASIDCLCLVPHLKKGAVIGFHDTVLNFSQANAGHITYQSLKLEKFEEVNFDAHGTGFCLYDGNEGSILQDLLMSFNLPWETTLSEELLNRLIALVGEHFGNRWRDKYADNLRNLSDYYAKYRDAWEEGRRKELDKVYGSTSWKITAPVRAVSSWFKR